MKPTEIEDYKETAYYLCCSNVHFFELRKLVDEQCDDMYTDYENSLCQHPTKSMSKLSLSETR